MSTDRIRFLYIGNDNLLTVERLESLSANSQGLVTVASCYVTLVVSGTETTVSGQAWPLALTLVSSETGTWQTTLQDTLSVTEGQYLEARITIDAGGLGQAYKRFPLKAVYDKN
jgi:hypothetical protein